MAFANVSNDVFALIDATALSFINTSFTNLWGTISVSFQGFSILFLILYGMAIWKGLIKKPEQELAWTLIR